MFRLILWGCVLTLFMGGCSLQNRQSEPQYFEHSVRYPGETLWLISRWYTGQGQNWKQILQVNTHIRPSNLRAGQRIRIPQQLVVKTDPLPKPRNPMGRTLSNVPKSTSQEEPEEDIWIDSEPESYRTGVASLEQEASELKSTEPKTIEPEAPAPSYPSRDELWGEITR